MICDIGFPDTLFGIKQQGPGCGSGFGKAGKQRITRVSGVEAEAALIHAALRMNEFNAAGSKQKGAKIAGFHTNPMQTATFAGMTVKLALLRPAAAVIPRRALLWPVLRSAGPQSPAVCVIRRRGRYIRGMISISMGGRPRFPAAGFRIADSFRFQLCRPFFLKYITM